MKKATHYITFITFSFIALLSSCHKNAYYQIDPDNPSVGDPALLLTGIQISVFNITHTHYSYVDRHLAYYERTSESMTYNWGTGSYNNYNILRNVQEMAKNGNDNYKALAKFFRAVLFSQLTETFGDIPYSEALRGHEGLATPKYDSQKEIYLGLLAELEEANNMLSSANGPITGDIIYGGRPDPVLQWKKLINAFRLRLLIHLSKKENDPDLNIKQQFQSIISNPTKYPLMNDNNDNGQIVYNTSATNNSYPTFQHISFATSVSMEKNFVNMLKDFQDPRLFSFAEPVSGRPANEFSSYDGVDGGLTLAEMQLTSASASRIKSRYHQNQVNEPTIFLGYAEQEFLIAEAIERGWISGAGTAKQHYDNGITASMAFYNITGGDVTTYLSNPGVAYNSATGLSQIAKQKYIAFFMNSGREAFFEQRRTGIPTLSVGPGTLNNGMVPKRWRYPANEFTINKENVEDAVNRQFNGNDNINSIMWLIQ